MLKNVAIAVDFSYFIQSISFVNGHDQPVFLLHMDVTIEVADLNNTLQQKSIHDNSYQLQCIIASNMDKGGPSFSTLPQCHDAFPTLPIIQ